MTDELVMCSCCGKFVPSSDIELSFQRPDEIAEMDEDEIQQRCRFNDDIYILDDKRYFIRCTLPLPVHERIEPYAIGAWAEVEENDFGKIWHLWEDENQAQFPPISALLANKVPLTKESQGCKILIRLTGPSTRPEIEILDPECSLHREQTCGIAVHRASEYSDLVRR